MTIESEVYFEILVHKLRKEIEEENYLNGVGVENLCQSIKESGNLMPAAAGAVSPLRIMKPILDGGKPWVSIPSNEFKN